MYFFTVRVVLLLKLYLRESVYNFNIKYHIKSFERKMRMWFLNIEIFKKSIYRENICQIFNFAVHGISTSYSKVFISID